MRLMGDLAKRARKVSSVRERKSRRVCWNRVARAWKVASWEAWAWRFHGQASRQVSQP